MSVRLPVLHFGAAYLFGLWILGNVGPVTVLAVAVLLVCWSRARRRGFACWWLSDGSEPLLVP